MQDNRPVLTDNALHLLKTRYLLKNNKKEIIETPRGMFERVAKCISYPEQHYKDEAARKHWYEIMLNAMLDLCIVPASPYLFNARDPEVEQAGGLFSCFVLPIEDSIDSIYRCLGECAKVYQAGGGIGIDFSVLRERNALVEKSKGLASGPMSFLNVFHYSSCEMTQGGVRRAASIAFMDMDHPEIEDFITTKSQDLPEINRLTRIILNSTDKALKRFAELKMSRLQRLTSFNLSVKMTDKFMEAVQQNADWTLWSRKTGKPVKTVKARKLFNLVCEYAWKSGDPGVCFIDNVNRDNSLPGLGRIEASNPCVPGDTLILTDVGYVEIQDVVGFATNIWNGEEWSSVVPCYTGDKDVMRIEFSNGQELTCTKNHEFITTNGRVKAEDLVIGAKLEKFNMPFVANGRDPDVDAYSHGFYCGDGTKNSNQSYIYVPKYNVLNRLVGNVGKELKNKNARIWWHGAMPPKDYVPLYATGSYVIEWLSGLLDADGTVIINPNSDSLQICSVNRQFLKDIQIMLTRVGVRATVDSGRVEKWMKDPKPQYGYYRSKICYRLCINCADTQHLLKHGLKCSRLSIREGEVQRDARRFVSVKAITDLQRKEPVYCFYEHRANRGTFNGIVTGQCGELYMHPYHACNLIGLNLNKFDLSNNLDQVFQFARIAARMAENAIDASSYPLPQIEEAVKKTRGIGIGVMGFSDQLIKLGIPYDTDEARNFISEIFRVLRDGAIHESKILATERGVPDNWEHSLWAPMNIKVRNLWHTTCQPTGSVSIIAGASQSLEPLWNVYCERRTHDGDTLTELHAGFRAALEYCDISVDKTIAELKRVGSIQRIDFIPDNVKRLFRCAHDIAPEDHVKMQAAAQKYVDSGISKTINMPPTATQSDVAKVYRLAHELGCKGTTVFREGSKQGVLSVVSAEDKYNEELRKWLVAKFCREGLTAREISDVLGVSEQCVFAKLKRYGIRKEEHETALEASRMHLNKPLADIILANLLVGHSKLQTVDHQSSYRQVTEHLVYAHSVRKKFLDCGIQCGDIMSIATDKTYYYFDTCFMQDIYDLPVDYDSVLTVRTKEDLLEFLTPYFVRHLFLIGGIKTGHGGVKFVSNSRNIAVLKRFMELLGRQLEIEINIRDDSVYLPKSSMEDFYSFLESGEDIHISPADRLVCPDCGGELVLNEKCRTCPSCGWSACSI